MRTPEQYVEDMKSIRSGITFWEPEHMATIIRQAQLEAARAMQEACMATIRKDAETPLFTIGNINIQWDRTAGQVCAAISALTPEDVLKG